MNTIETIRAALPEDELLAQLAEEAAELAHAALKLRRCINGKNPTPIMPTQAEANLIEELADVRLCAEVLDRGTRIQNQIDGIATSKLGRWAKRLEEVKLESNLRVLESSFRVNEPLTEDELRQMMGEPVWCVYEGGAKWFIVGESLFTILNGVTAYRNKPEK